MIVHRRVTPNITFAGNHLKYTWMEERHCDRTVKCPVQEHHTLSPSRARTKTVRSAVEHIYLEATPRITSCCVIVNDSIVRCWESRRWAWCKVNMPPVIEASGRVHGPHVPWSLLSAEIFIQDISGPSLVVCCTWEYWYWCCVSSIKGYAQAFWSRYVGVFLVSIHCLADITSPIVTVMDSNSAENRVCIHICSSRFFS